MSYKEITGNLISLAKSGEFDVICHGTNCFNAQASGIAKQMVENFDTNNPSIFKLEGPTYKGDINKLGQIEYQPVQFIPGAINKVLVVANLYTQYYYKKIHPDGFNALCVDYTAVALCMKKINHIFKGKRIGLPKIGSALGGGDWDIIRAIIKEQLKDCDVTVVNYDQS